MNGKKTAHYDKRQVCESMIFPIIDEIKAICRKQRIPFFFSVLTSQNSNGYVYKREGMTPAALFVDVDDCEVYQHILSGAPGFIAMKKHGQNNM
jgi:hypothetical protein